MASSGKGVLLAGFKLSSPGNCFSVSNPEYVLNRETGRGVEGENKTCLLWRILQ